MNGVLIEETRAALAHIPADDRDVWVRMAFAVKAAHGEEGFDIWNEWSQGADNYNAKAASDVWRSANPNGGIGYGTLIHEAKERGYRPNGNGSKVDVAELERARGAREAKDEAERKARAARAAAQTVALWKAATPARTDHPYLLRKGITPVSTMRELRAQAVAELIGYIPKAEGEPLIGRLLILPVKIGEAISTAELIDENGSKSALFGGTRSGGYWAAQPLPDKDGSELSIAIGEGAATVVSVRQATGLPVVASFGSSNLLNVCRTMRSRYPQARIVVMADLGNGEEKAREAAQEIGALLALPDFGADRTPDQKDFNDMEQASGLEAVKAIIDRAKPAPQKIASTPAKPQDAQDAWPAALAPDAFYGLAGEVVRAIEPQTEADPAAILLQVFVAFGALVGRGPHVQVEGDEHHGNLFALIVGQTSKARKGTSWGRVREIFSRAEQWPKVVDGLSSGEGLKWNVRDQVTATEKDDKGFAKEVERDPGVTDKRLLVMEPEFAQVIRQTARAGNTLSPTIRSAWDSGNLQTLTKHDPVKASGAHICIVGHITSDELRAELTQTDIANGFANRFLFMCVKRSKVLALGGKPLAPEMVSGFASRFARAAGKARMVGAVGMTPEARETWETVYGPLSEGYPGMYGAVTGRAEAQCLRLALVYALMDEAKAIDQPHLLAALAIWDRAAASARYIFGDSLGDAVADTILRGLRNAGKSGLTRTAISSLLGRNQTAERIAAALELLNKRGLAHSETRQTGGAAAEVWTSP